MGDALEKYVIDTFTNTFLETNEIDGTHPGDIFIHRK